MSAATVDITNIDTSKVTETDNMDAYQRMAFVSSTNMFVCAEKALDEHPNLEKVTVMEYAPRYDTKDVDPLNLKPALAKVAKKSLSSKTTPQQSSSSKSVPKTPPSSAAHHGGSSASEQRGCPPTAPPPATTPRPTPTNQRKPKSKYQEKTKVLYVEQLKSQRLKKKLNVLSKQQKPTAPMRILKLFGLPKTLLKLSRMSSQNLQLIV